MPSITQLEYLLAVDKEKHFGKAARECNVSQPSLSAQIQKLEDDLGVIIFDRSKKPILETEIGKVLIEQSRVIVREHKKLSALATQGAKEPRGEFNLAVIPTLAPYLIPLFVGQFSKKFPHVRLKINEYKTEDIVKSLVNDDVDAGLLVTPLEDERLIERHLFYEPFFAYIAEDHPLSKKKFIVEDDLDAKKLWVLEEGHCFRSQVLKICSMDKNQSVLPNVEFTGGSLETLKNLVRKSSGYTLLPELACNDMSPEELNTYIRKFRKPVPTREVSLVHSRSFLKETTIQALEDIILATLPSKIKSLKRQDMEIIALV